MALVTSFERDSARRVKSHPTTVECFWSVLEQDGKAALLQLDTRGSMDRAKPGKQSQTLQLDRASAGELVTILTRVFKL